MTRKGIYHGASVKIYKFMALFMGSTLFSNMTCSRIIILMQYIHLVKSIEFPLSPLFPLPMALLVFADNLLTTDMEYGYTSSNQF
mmetsp:Transcript_3936/g.10315  ORF Transcript_3936/g.10315 Transcript_3936/m.10315 type:complete len:85 (+) Transcript_3936:258-512(+)